MVHLGKMGRFKITQEVILQRRYFPEIKQGRTRGITFSEGKLGICKEIIEKSWSF